MSERESYLTSALEDYLETIYLIRRDQKFARVRDIARARSVKMSSVTPAMKRLAEMGLIEYSQREYIDLTPEGESVARRVFARHGLLRHFFSDFLRIDTLNAEADACLMEHHLSNESMDKLTQFFEFLASNPKSKSHIYESFHNWQRTELRRVESNAGGGVAAKTPGAEATADRKAGRRTLLDLKPGEKGTITRISALGAIRQRLLDMGMLPNTEVILERLAPTGDPIWIRMQGFQLSLRRNEAKAITIK